MSTSAKQQAWRPIPADICSSTREPDRLQLTLGTERHFHRGNGAARLFEFDQTGKYLREIGQGLYGFVFAHTVRVDPQDNIWTVDEGAGTIVKFNPQGKVQMVLGRTPEYLPMPSMERVNSMGTVPKPTGPVGVGVEGDEFDRPTDVAWDKQGNIFIADGHVNSRIAKFDSNGRFVKSWGSQGTAPGQFNVPHSLVTDAQGNVYVADRDNRRIQVFDNNGTFKTQFINVGTPWTLCITPGSHQYPVQLEFERPARVRQGRRDLQDGARRPRDRQVWARRPADERVQHGARDRLQK